MPYSLADIYRHFREPVAYIFRRCNIFFTKFWQPFLKLHDVISQNLNFLVIFTEFHLVPVLYAIACLLDTTINSTLLTVGCETVMERPAG